MDWNPTKYARFSGLRLRPALDLLAQVGDLPPGDICDLGCGAGVVGPILKDRFAGRQVVGLDSSAAMLAQAQATGAYDALHQADIAAWGGGGFALIYSNAVLHWLDDHPALLRRLAGQLVPGGMLAVQVPHQNAAPSHRGWVDLAATLFSDLPDLDSPGILTAPDYFSILSPLGAVSIWETEYFQRLDPSSQGHPVRLFTETTFARPILNALSGPDRATLIAAYDARMDQAYPRQADGAVLFPFRRLFFTLTMPECDTNRHQR